MWIQCRGWWLLLNMQSRKNNSLLLMNSNKILWNPRLSVVNNRSLPIQYWLDCERPHSPKSWILILVWKYVKLGIFVDVNTQKWKWTMAITHSFFRYWLFLFGQIWHFLYPLTTEICMVIEDVIYCIDHDNKFIEDVFIWPPLIEPYLWWSVIYYVGTTLNATLEVHCVHILSFWADYLYRGTKLAVVVFRWFL